MIRPLNSSHCAICSNCISIFDHHCPFLSTCALYTCNLLGYHTMISSRSLTTRQDDKRIYINKNPFNTHSWFLNLVRKLCTSLPPSACDYRRKNFNSKFYLFIFFLYLRWSSSIDKSNRISIN
jgi:hypothetical protein